MTDPTPNIPRAIALAIVLSAPAWAAIVWAVWSVC